MQWIVPDAWSKESLEKMGTRDVEVSGSSSVLKDALTNEGPRLLVLRATSGHGLLLAKINPPQQQSDFFGNTERVGESEQPSYRAGGFLGLSDEPIYEDEAPSKKKKRFWQ